MRWPQEEAVEVGGRTALAIDVGADLCASSEGDRIVLWSLGGGARRRDLRAKVSSPIVDLAFAGPAHLLATTETETLLYDLHSGGSRFLGTGGGRYVAVAANPDGTSLAVLGGDGVILWRRDGTELEIADRVAIHENEKGEVFPFQRGTLAFGADGRIFFGTSRRVWLPATTASSGSSVVPESLVDTFQIEGRGRVVTLGSEGSLLTEGESPPRVAAVDRLGGVACWRSQNTFDLRDPNGRPLSPELDCAGREISCLALSHDGSTVVAADFDHHLWCWWRGDLDPGLS